MSVSDDPHPSRLADSTTQHAKDNEELIRTGTLGILYEHTANQHFPFHSHQRLDIRELLSLIVWLKRRLVAIYGATQIAATPVTPVEERTSQVHKLQLSVNGPS